MNCRAVPSLTIGTSNDWRPPFPDPDNPEVEVWRERDGAISAYGHTVDADHWLHLPGIASFRFRTAGGVHAVPAPAAMQERIVDAYHRNAVPIVLQARGLEVLHASAVLTTHGVVALCGVREAGKSTIAYALNLRGFPLWADDAVAFAASEKSVRAFSLPFAPRLRPAAASFFGRDHPVPQTRTYGDESSMLASAPLAAVCVLNQTPVSGVAGEVRRLASAGAFTSVLTHAYSFTLQDIRRNKRMAEQYFRLVHRVPIFELRFSSGLGNLSAVVEEIDRSVIGCVSDAG